MSDIVSTAQKRSRVTRACDFCHRRGRKCRLATDRPHECTTCISHNVRCSWDRVAAKRGVKPGPKETSQVWTVNENRHGSHMWLEALVDIFFADVYPIVCIVQEASFRTQWETSASPNGPASFARFIAVCALSAQRVASGASSVGPNLTDAISPHIYVEDGVAAIKRGLPEMRDKQWLQATHLLAVVAMEMGNASLFHQLMGTCCSLIADQGLVEESRWPGSMSALDREEYRRLIWHLYRLEVHTALIMGSPIRLSESQINVDYPGDPSFDSDVSGNDDENLWLEGWNFVTDLYRGLEHVLVAFRLRGHSTQSSRKARLFGTPILTDDSKAQLLEHLEIKHNQLPRQLREANCAAVNGRDRIVYQYANIVCTHQLLKMLSYASGQVTFRNACHTVLDLVDGISAVPVEILRSMSLAMVQELSGFGHLLSTFIGSNLQRTDYERLRSVMTCMSDLLACLVSSIPAAHNTVKTMSRYINVIDERLTSSTHSFPEEATSSTVVDWSDIENHSIVPEYNAFDHLTWLDIMSLGFDRQLFE